MKKFSYMIAGLAVATMLVGSQNSTPDSDLTVSKTKERIWTAAQSKSG